MLFDHVGDIFYFSVAITINKSEPLNFIIDSLCCKFSQRVDGFKIWGWYSAVGIDMKKI